MTWPAAPGEIAQSAAKYSPRTAALGSKKRVANRSSTRRAAASKAGSGAIACQASKASSMCMCGFWRRGRTGAEFGDRASCQPPWSGSAMRASMAANVSSARGRARSSFSTRWAAARANRTKARS
ncbi:hypothetical protein D3C77_487700 [compost metagenome]